MADKEKDAEHTSLPGSQDASSSNANGTGQQPRRMVPPEIIRNMTPEHREQVEKRLKRKIDGRLLPTIIIMYILNYIDRCASPGPRRFHTIEGTCAYTLIQKQHRRRRACWLERRSGS